MEMLDGIVAEVPPRARKLAAAYWPGPLTMVLPRGPEVSGVTCAGLDTVGVRMPSHPVVQAVIRASGVAFAAPSANLSGKPSPTNAADTLADMDGRLPLILDGGDCAVGVESTVVSLVGEHPVLLRPGYITREQLEAALGEEVLVSHAILEKLRPGETARSPGMKYKHYAPKPKSPSSRAAGTPTAPAWPPMRAPASGRSALTARARAWPTFRSPPSSTGPKMTARPRRTACSPPCASWTRRAQRPSTPAARAATASRWPFTTGCCARRPSASWRCDHACDRHHRPFRLRKIDGHAAVRLARLPLPGRRRRRAGVLQPGSPCIAQLQNAFGSDIVEADGTLRRRLLADRAFATKEGAARLTAITHPEILRRIAAWVEETRRTGAALAFVDGAVIARHAV